MLLLLLLLLLTDHGQVSPVEEVGEAFGTVALDDALSSVEPGEVEHVRRQLVQRLVQRNETTVHHVDTVAHRVGDVVAHEATESCSIESKKKMSFLSDSCTFFAQGFLGIFTGFFRDS